MMVPINIIFVTISLVGGCFGLGVLNLVPSSITSSLMSKPTSNVMISMGENAMAQLAKFNEGDGKSREERAAEVSQVLQSFAQASQAPVLSMLKSMNVQAESYWISNQIFVKEASPSVLQALTSISGIQSIMEEGVFDLPPLFDAAAGSKPNGTPEWNIKIMEADKVWEKTKGAGIVVAGIDTGVRRTHSALKENYVGSHNYGWYDPILSTQEPCDLQGHGTHTMGTIVGQNGIGVAPEAKWMACRGCLLQGCLQHALLACGQFVLCPSDVGSKGKKCEGVPDIVNNSWGTGGGQKFFDPIIKAWLAAGIKPFFANGNSGPKCETGGSPGDNDNVIAVGSTNKKDKLSKFSSRGPKVKYEKLADTNEEKPNNQGIMEGLFNTGKKKIVTDTIKPDICAPGEKVNSANIISDDSYKELSGTSMATPAVAGVAALLLSKNPKMTLDELKGYLYSTTDTDLDLTPKGAEQCGPIPEDEYPNHMCGHGRINAWKAYQKMTKEVKEEKKDGGKRKKKKKVKEQDEDKSEE